VTLTPSPHAVARLRSERLARSAKPFLARGGPSGERCPGCRLRPSHCLCALRPQVPTRAGVCLLMADTEALKPSNTGWLVADVVADTFAFGWARTEVHPGLLALLADPAVAAVPGVSRRLCRTAAGGDPGGAPGTLG
jgi:DTW domain-containing protein YfiP